MIWQFFFSSLIFVYFCFDLLYTRFWSISSHFVRLLLPCFVSISFIMFISVGSGGGWRVDSGTRKTRKKQRKANWVESWVSTVRKIIEKLRNFFFPFFSFLLTDQKICVDHDDSMTHHLCVNSFSCNHF